MGGTEVLLQPSNSVWAERKDDFYFSAGGSMILEFAFMFMRE